MRSVFILLLAVAIWQNATANTVYQAASASLARGAVLQPCPDCPGGKRVAQIGGDDNGTVAFTNVTVERGGLYPVTVHFTVSDDRSLDLSVNQETNIVTVIFRRNAQKGGVSSQT